MLSVLVVDDTNPDRLVAVLVTTYQTYAVDIHLVGNAGSRRGTF